MVTSRYLFVLLFALATIQYSHAGVVDSLLQVYRELPENERLSIIGALVRSCDLNPECHDRITGELWKMSSPNIKYYAEQTGIRFANAGYFDTARGWYRSALTANTGDNDPEYEGLMYNLIANAYQRHDPGDSLIFYREKALNTMDPSKHYAIWQVYFWFAQDMIMRNQDEEALAWTEKAYGITRRRNIRMDNGYVLFHLVKMALDTGSPRYHEYMNDYIVFRNAAPGNSDSNHDALLSVLLDSESAKEKLLLLTENIDSVNGIAASHYYSLRALGTLQMNDGEYTEAEQSFRRSIDKASAQNWIFSELQSYQYLNRIAGLSENNDLRLESLEKILVLRENVNNERFEQEMARMQVAYNTREKELQLEVARRDKNLLTGAMFGMGLIVLLLAGMVVQKKRSNRVLEQKNGIIEQALADKNILLREIHHRVKNNLQMVSSLLQLQSRYMTEPGAIEALSEGENRVKSMAIIHHHLYSSNQVSKVNVRGYIDNLCENISASYNFTNSDITLTKKIDDLTVDVSVMVPLGLILNELITNSYKYAFNGRTSGIIHIQMTDQNGTLFAELRDNGTGIDSKTTKPGFGSRMISAFIRKLEADMEVTSVDGTRVIIRIPEYEKEDHFEMIA